MDGVVIVTGASRGIGLATAVELARRGFKVVLCSRDAVQAEAAAKTVGNGAIGVAADVSRPEECRKLFDIAEQRFGHVDFLVNNAGTGRAGKLAEAADAEIRNTVATNLEGVIYCCREAARRIRAGAIVNVSSFYGSNAPSGVSVYAATKHAVNALSKSLSKELYPGVKVFVVSPSSVDTLLLRKNFAGSGGDKPERIAGIIAGLIVGWEKTDSGTFVEVWKLPR